MTMSIAKDPKDPTPVELSPRDLDRSIGQDGEFEDVRLIALQKNLWWYNMTRGYQILALNAFKESRA